jgi:hypothetical protein
MRDCPREWTTKWLSGDCAAGLFCFVGRIQLDEGRDVENCEELGVGSRLNSLL